MFDVKKVALDVISSILAPAKPGEKKTLDDVKLDDLRREKTRLDLEERKMLARIREVESDKKKLFEEGVKNPSEREQKIMARKIKELDVEAKNMDRNLQFFSKQLRIINGFLQLKENQRIIKESGISSVIGDIDLQTLQIYVDQATVDGEFHMDKFSEILGTLEEAGSVTSVASEDDDVMQIVKAMQQAKESEDPARAVSDKYDEVDKLLASRSKEKPEEE